jgi:hypothetical protein
MNKLFAVVLSVLFVVAAAAPLMATDARQESMAFVGNYIEDDYNIFTWYATLPSYSNMVWIGMQDLNRNDGNDMFYYLGASYGLGSENKYGTIAMFLYDYSVGISPMTYSPWEEGPGVFSQSLDNKFTMLYAYPMEKMSLGLFFSRADRAAKNEGEELTTAQEYHYAYTTLGAGLRFDMGEKVYTDVAVDLNIGSFKDNFNEYSGYGEVTADANKMYGFRGRMFYQWNETITWVPYASFRMFDFSLKADSTDFADTHFGDKGMMFNIGLGANIKVNEDNLLVFALEPYGYEKYEPSNPPTGETGEFKVTTMPRLFLALESDVKDWLTLRAGASKDLYKDESKHEMQGVVPDKSTFTGTSFDFYLGLGFHVADFDIDAVIDNQLPMHLGYWLTGYGRDYNDGGNNQLPILVLTAAYHF